MSIVCCWNSVNIVPTLEKYEAHVWCADLNFSEEEIPKFFELLSEEEKNRAQRFHFTKDRTHFIAARSLLRKILAQYVNIAPEKLQFIYNAFGKPALQHHADLQFNLSHSHSVALFAITREQSIGVDIEFMERNCDIDAIVERYFSANEYLIIKNLSGREKIQAFFNGWARKEAFLKALGEGLSYPLAQVEVTLNSAIPAKIIALHDIKLNLVDWHLQALDPLPHYAAALVVKGNLQSVKTGLWIDS